ncbi:hydrolase [Mycolicibacterium litorale]|uniref:Hydrolase n=1 Tax=Mycolicibacterium litorale TaxID=758802 RepID=A0A6S6PDS1_9MYCO|nr:nitrilase-related carbon-nitrogen hydrolase [Mycolicibacterium litorale]BCI56116.1 hydrolase [Mycolicibacterium litorale]
MSDRLRVAAVQFDLQPVTRWADFADRVSRRLDEAAGADVVVFGECMTAGLAATAPGWQDRHPREAFAGAADLTADYEALFTEAAVARGQIILAGSQFVTGPAGLRNVAHVFTPDAEVLRHHKTHLFPAEWDYLADEGDEVTCFTVADVTCGVLVCYEAEVPEVATIYSRLGVDVLLCPSYTFTEAGFHRVRKTLAARCIENQVYAVHCPVVGAGAGPIAPARGRASVLGPCEPGLPDDGVIALGPADTEAVLNAELDLALLRELRHSGVAPTVRDRTRKRAMYERYADRLWP